MILILWVNYFNCIVFILEILLVKIKCDESCFDDLYGFFIFKGIDICIYFILYILFEKIF